VIISVAVLFLALSFQFIGYNHNYNKLTKDYKNIFNRTIEKIDLDNVGKSIQDNNLANNVEQLNELLNKLGNNIPRSKTKEFVLYTMEQNLLDKAIEKGLKWDTLGNYERNLVRQLIESLKPIE
jgi:hypothetical protein